MRKIKIRIWDIENQKMIYPKKTLKHYLFGCEPILEQSLFKRFNPENIIVSQNIGIEDKNGKEIYEGDIVKIQDSQGRGIREIFEVSFRKGCFGYLTKEGKIGRLATWIDAIWVREQDPENFIEVLGNIFENPELIEEERS